MVKKKNDEAGPNPLPEVKKEEQRGKKTLVLDTNVILHDASCLNNFQEHDIVIPMAVLEELDTFKKGTGQINISAREFCRVVDKLTEEKIFNGGVSLGEGRGKLRVSLGVHYPEIFKISLSDPAKPDHQILATAYSLQQQGEKVVLVTKDINLRMKAKGFGVLAEDYRSDRVENLDILAKPIRPIAFQDVALLSDLKENDFFRSEGKLFYWHQKKLRPLSTVKRSCVGILPRNDEQQLAMEMLLNPDILVVAITGSAGTGKSLLALAAGIEQQKSSRTGEYESTKKKKAARKGAEIAQTFYEEVFVTRPIVPLSNKDLGALPGDLEDKVSPYMDPLYKTIDFIRRANCASLDSRDEGRKKWMEERRIRVETAQFIRGASIPNTFMIIDESQNLTPHEVKTIATRAEEGTKIVFMGDPSQIDTPYLDEKTCGLSYLIDRAAGQPYFAHINLVKGERSFLAEQLSRIL
ncbi:MAG: PhoH family protein [Candidatus Peribacteria bacterium]|jgi:PhoH-like ATPase|nr:PhoH family protein [Candidatus Peribacteria bacterium]